jgi:hypothetical protein
MERSSKIQKAARMILWRKKSPYLRDGRLADVIAALQVMSARDRPEGEITHWSRTLSHDTSAKTVERWSRVFNEHSEFFLVYTLKDSANKKSALRVRYANRNFDPRKGIELNQDDIDKLQDTEREHLTTKPLAADAISALTNTAIELHNRAIQELSARRWWVPFVAAILGFSGAVAGAGIGAIWGHSQSAQTSCSASAPALPSGTPVKE